MPLPVLTFDRLEPEPHGGTDGVSQARIDFSVNSNPFAPSEQLLEQLKNTPIHIYPDPNYHADKTLVANFHGLSPQQLSFANGSADMIYRLSCCYLRKGRSVLLAAPCFAEYARAASLASASVQLVFPYQQAKPEVRVLLEAIKEQRPTLVWLCQPNNPTGHSWQAEDLEQLVSACSKVDALLILDLAYQDFLQNAPYLPPLSEHCLQLHSLTKSFGMAGIRAGYALATSQIIEVLEQATPPWQLSSHAQVASRWALSEQGQAFLAQTLPALPLLKRDFQQGLRALGYRTLESQTHFFLLEVTNASAFKAAALQEGFRVRDCSSFGLQQHIRLSTQKAADNQALLNWLSSRKREVDSEERMHPISG